MAQARFRTGLCILAIIGVIFAVYANSFSGAFLFDDHQQILGNPFIREWKSLPLIFTSGFGRFDITGANYYRPLIDVSFLVDHTLWGTDKFGNHLTSVLFHAAGAITLFLLLNILFKNIKTALLTALLFSVHPIYTSGVTYLSGRGDAMMIFLVLLALFFLVKFMEESTGKKNFVSLAVSAGSFFLALLTKESALFIGASIILYGFYRANKATSADIKKRWVKVCIFFSVAIILYLLLRANAIKMFYTPQYNVAAHMGTILRLLTAAKAFLAYLAILLLPFGLHFERNIPKVGSISDPAVLLAICAIVSMLYLTVIAGRRKGPVYFGFLWFFLTFIPVSNFIIPLNSFVAENWIQLPAIGIFLAVTAFVVRVSEERRGHVFLNAVGKLPLVLFVFALIFYACLTVGRNSEYRDPIFFYESALKYEPNSVKLLNNLGLEYEIRKDMEKAKVLYIKVLDIKPDHIATLNNLANAYSAEGQYDSAVDLYKKALSVNPDNRMFINNLGVAYIRKGDKQNAVRCWQRSLELDPNQPQIKDYIKWNQ